jgi:hypothetical protein
VAKANYHQIRRQKELARKTRQEEKKQKRQALKAGEPDTSELSTSDSTAAEAIDAGPQSTASVDQPVADSAGSAAGQSSTRS